MSRGPRRRLAPGIYADASGVAAVVTVNRLRREKRWPPDTPLPVIRRWMTDTRQALGLLPRRDRRRTFAEDADQYLRLSAHLAEFSAVRAEVRALVAAFGDTRRHHLTPTHVRRAIVTWSTAGIAPKTINHRLARLRRIFRVLDGPRAPTPADGIRSLAVPRVPIRVVDDATIRSVAEHLEQHEQSGRLPDAKTRARFLLLALTGRRPCEIMAATPADVDLDRRVWTVRDAKGGRSPGLYLTDDMLAAWRLFTAAKAWGEYNTSAFARTLRGAGWPADVRPYQLRHTVGVRLSEAGTDLADIAAWLGHKRLETARQRYVPVLGSRMQAAGERLSGRNLWHQPVARGETGKKSEG